jgi:hypothetical protein
MIALDAPSEPGFELAHIDHSFNALCEILGKPHRQLRSVQAIMKDLAKSNEADPTSS